MPPVIGITGRRSLLMGEFPHHLGRLQSDLYVVDYGRAVAAAGGVPVLLTRDADPAELVGRLDGIVLAGGEDVDPRRYGSVPGAFTTVLDPDRDAFESELVTQAVDSGTPLLGICRGAQLLNVALGGTLVADLPAGEGDSHAFLGYPAEHRSHPVVLTAGSTLARLFGAQLRVNSYHHQAVATPGTGLVVTGRAPDGVVEAIELPGADVLGVQWHPELLDQPDPLFSWLVARAVNRTSAAPPVHHEEMADAVA